MRIKMSEVASQRMLKALEKMLLTGESY